MCIGPEFYERTGTIRRVLCIIYTFTASMQAKSASIPYDLPPKGFRHDDGVAMSGRDKSRQSEIRPFL